MLKLERLELHGFKSFHDRTEVHFDDGVTAVVGPNGCGKSNLLDAMTWVLGEQSVKSLRGSASEDLIFAGTQTKRPLGMAEVTLKLRATNGDLPMGQESVAVTRRLFRSGESEYQLNGIACRLKDIQDVLYGSGLGVKAYSFMEQGKIGAILAARPLDRRALIEEAAGITKFRAKKREAELKLEAAQQNLVRVHDIVAEVEKQLASLKRQASRARRHELVRDELRSTLCKLYLQESEALAARDAETQSRHRAEAARRAELITALERAESELDELRAGIEKDESASRGTARKLQETEVEVDRNRNVIVSGRERLEELEARVTELREALTASRARHAETAASLERKRAESAAADRRETDARVAVEGRRGKREEAARGTEAAESEIESDRTALLEAVHRSADASNALSGRRQVLDQLVARRERLAAEQGRLEQDGRAAAAGAAGRLSEMTAAETRVTALGAEVGRCFEQSGELAREREACRREHEERRVEVGAREERSRALASITDRAEDAGQAAAAARLALGERSRGLVADHIEAEERYERAVEAALEPLLGAVVVSDEGSASGLLAEASAREGGLLRLLLVGDRPACPPPLPEGIERAPGVLGRLSDFVRLRNGVGAAIGPLLDRTLLVGRLREAFGVRGSFPDAHVVTLAGEVLEPVGLLRAGAASEHGLLALRRERREIEQELVAGRAALAALAARLELLESGSAAAEGQARERLADLHEAEKALLGARHRLGSAEADLRKVEDATRAVVLEREALDTEVAQGEREEEGARRAVDVAAEAERAVGERLERARARLEAARVEAALRAEELVEAESELARSEEVLKAVRAEIRSLEEAAGERADSIRTLEGEERESGERLETVTREVEAAEEAMTGLLAEVAALKDRVRTEEDAVRALRHDLVSREGQLKELRLQAELQRERVQAVEIERTRIEGEIARLSDRCRDDLGLSLAAVAEGAGGAPQGGAPVALAELDAELGEDAGTPEEARDEATDAARAAGDAALTLEELRLRADTLKVRIARLGPVNVLAIEEYQELKTRHDFLTTQAADLTESIESLVQTIARINRTSRERFVETYEQVNRNFQEIFVRLFNGGRAELRLTDEENLLETGVDIVAQPPGKRLQNILLLSGGEKALTALSLLFALFQYKPSPFCILDEVDAPLDEKNIDRFLALLQTLRTGTQFILITHSPRTMKVADTLYGVTMEEPGVSRLVSVKLNDAAA